MGGPRHYVVMEVKSNLIAAERKEILNCFSTPNFKKVAHVVMGVPNDEYKAKQCEKLLKEKQDKADIEWKAKKAEEERKKQVAERQAQLAKMRKDAEEKRKRVIEEARKKAQALKRKQAAEQGEQMEDDEVKKEEDAAMDAD